MNLTDLLDRFRATATAVNPTGFFMFGLPEDKNVDSANIGGTHAAPKKPYPQIYVELARENIKMKDGDVADTFVIIFVAQDKPDSATDRRDPAIFNREQLTSDMRNLAHSFLDYFYENNDDLSLGDAAEATPEQRMLIGLGTGYSVQFDVLGKLNCI